MRLRPPVTTRPATPVPYPTVCRSEEERAGRGHLPDTEEHRRAQPDPPPLLWFVHGRTLPIRPSLGRLGSDLEGPRRHLGGVRVGDEALTTDIRSEEHTSELQSLMRISYAVFCLKKKTTSP